MYSTHNEGKSVVTEKFIRTLQNKTYKYMTLISKNVYLDKLDDIANKYTNTYHNTTDVKSTNFGTENYTKKTSHKGYRKLILH